MPHILIVDLDGREITAEAAPGLSLMEIIRDAGSEGLLALCGGCCSCATCHVYVEPHLIEALPPMSIDENELLDSSNARKPVSRLSCQIPFNAGLNGIRLTIAPQD